MSRSLWIAVFGGALLYAQDPWIAKKEAAMGASLMQELLRQSRVVEDVEVRQYIDRLVSQLAAQIPGGRQWQNTVIEDQRGGSTREPAAFPGAYITIPLPLIAAAQNEAELAGMIAHAMAHVVREHARRAATVTNAASVPLIFMGGWESHSGQNDGLLVPIALVPRMRESELQADQLAIRVMADAGYDPTALAAYLRRTQPERSNGSAIYSTLPPRQERLANLTDAIAQLPSRTYTDRSAGEFAAIRERARASTVRPEPAPPTLRRKSERQ